MKIVELRADNFKRLKAIEIKPAGALVEITGKNGAGKSSVLDAIWAALAGKEACPPQPIRRGEEEARISLDLGELKIVRKFRAQEGGEFTTTLQVESAEGARFPSPQGILDALVGELSLDPIAFERMGPKQQFELCRAFVPDVDFASIEGMNLKDFEHRTEVNRRAKELRAQASALPEIAGDIPPLVDIGEIEGKLADAARINSDIEHRRGRRAAAAGRLDEIKAQIDGLRAEKGALEAQLAGAEPLPEPIDIDKTREALAAGRQANELTERALRRREIEESAKAAEEHAAALTQSIEKRKAKAAEAVGAADMPIPGLGFGEGIVTLNGLPFEQASDAERLRASIAIAGAMNPKLRIIRVRDGSLLDSDGFEILRAYAQEHDLQVWIEVVESGRPHAVLIEDGEIAPAPIESGGEIL